MRVHVGSMSLINRTFSLTRSPVSPHQPHSSSSNNDLVPSIPIRGTHFYFQCSDNVCSVDRAHLVPTEL